MRSGCEGFGGEEKVLAGAEEGGGCEGWKEGGGCFCVLVDNCHLIIEPTTLWAFQQLKKSQRLLVGA